MPNSRRDDPSQDGDSRKEGGQQSHRREDPEQSGKPQQRQAQHKQQWSRPRSPYRQEGPTGNWVDPYTKRPGSSRAFNRVSQEELDAITQRLRQPTVSSTGAKELRDKQFVYTEPEHSKSNPRLKRRKPQPRTDEERSEIAQRLFSAKTRAWVARREKNPNTRVHYSTDFTII